MPLAGLVMIDDDAFAPAGSSCALLPVAGQTLVEYQVRIARSCGADHIVALADRIPAPLMEAFDRLRADGIAVEIARNASEAADRIHPEEGLLIIGSGIVASRDIVATLSQQPRATLLTVRDGAGTDHYERIDALDRWGGLALLNGKLLRDTSAMLGDWALGPTLLRTALQAGAERLPAEGQGLALVRDEREARQIAEALARGNSAMGSGFWQAQVVDPLVRWSLPWLVGSKISLELLMLVPAGLMAAAMLAGVLGWIAPSFGLFLLAGFPWAAAKALANITARPDRVLRWTAEAKLPMLLVLLGFAGWTLDVPRLGWGPMVLALWAGIALMLQPRSSAREDWIADADLIALELLMGSLIGQPVLALMIAVAHAVISQFWLVRHPG